MNTTAEGRLRALGITLPELLPVIGSYRLAKRHGDIVYVAGHVSLKLDRSGLTTGKVGNEISTQQAQEAARACALHMLASLHAEIGSLDRVDSSSKSSEWSTSRPDSATSRQYSTAAPTSSRTSSATTLEFRPA